MMHQERLAAQKERTWLENEKSARAHLFSPQHPHTEVTRKGRKKLCIMYFDSLPCLNYYVDSANPDFMC